MWQLKYVLNETETVETVESKALAEQKVLDMILEEYKEVEGDIICEDGDDTRFDDLLNDPNIIVNWKLLLPRFRQEIQTGQCKGIGGYSLYTINPV